MKTLLLAFATVTTSAAIVSSIYLAGLENPTEIQRQLSTTTNTVSVAGTTAIFKLLEDDAEDKDSGY